MSKQPTGVSINTRRRFNPDRVLSTTRRELANALAELHARGMGLKPSRGDAVESEATAIIVLARCSAALQALGDGPMAAPIYEHSRRVLSALRDRLCAAVDGNESWATLARLVVQGVPPVILSMRPGAAEAVDPAVADHYIQHDTMLPGIGMDGQPATDAPPD